MSLVVLTSVFVACSKEEAAPTTPSTSLEITVKDGDNSAALVSDATVSLSESEDMKNPITIKSNNKGVAKFTDLKDIAYYVLVKKGCQNNLYFSPKTQILKANTLNKQDVAVIGTGDLIISNPTSDTYSCVLVANLDHDNDPSTPAQPTKLDSMPSVTLTPNLSGKYPIPLPLGSDTKLGIVKIVDGKVVAGSDKLINFTISCDTQTTVTLP